MLKPIMVENQRLQFKETKDKEKSFSERLDYGGQVIAGLDDQCNSLF